MSYSQSAVNYLSFKSILSSLNVLHTIQTKHSSDRLYFYSGTWCMHLRCFPRVSWCFWMREFKLFSHEKRGCCSKKVDNTLSVFEHIYSLPSSIFKSFVWKIKKFQNSIQWWNPFDNSSIHLEMTTVHIWSTFCRIKKKVGLCLHFVFTTTMFKLGVL